MANTPQPEPEAITSTASPDVERVKAWLSKMVKEGRFVELIVAVVALIARLRDLNTHLMQRVVHLTRRRPPSEKLARLENQLVLQFPGWEVQQPPKKKRGGGGGPRPNHPGRRPLPSHLPRVEEQNPVPEALRDCPQCGKRMDHLGHETCEILDVRPAELVVKVRQDESVRCPIDGTIVSAPPPNRIVPKGKLGDTFIVEALADKYLLQLPIERQCREWARRGIDVPPQTLGRSVAAAIDLLGPLASYLLSQTRTCEILSIDSTGIRVLDPAAPEGRRYGTMWCGIGDGRFVAFYYCPAGDAASVTAFLGTDDFSGRTIQCDGTSVTNGIERKGGRRPGCWSHGRRRLVEAGRSGDSLALEGLRLIAKLFVVDRLSALLGESPEERQARRQEYSQDVLEELRQWVEHYLDLVPPKSPLGKALNYLRRQWPRLLLFLDDGRLELTNNHVERALRPLVLGLKNWLFVYEDLGGQRTATILTIIGTCVAQRVDPRAFLHKALGLIVAGLPEEQVAELAPERLAERFPELRAPARASPTYDEHSLAELVSKLEAALARPLPAPAP